MQLKNIFDSLLFKKCFDISTDQGVRSYLFAWPSVSKKHLSVFSIPKLHLSVFSIPKLHLSVFSIPKLHLSVFSIPKLHLSVFSIPKLHLSVFSIPKLHLSVFSIPKLHLSVFSIPKLHLSVFSIPSYTWKPLPDGSMPLVSSKQQMTVHFHIKANVPGVACHPVHNSDSIHAVKTSAHSKSLTFTSNSSLCEDKMKTRCHCLLYSCWTVLNTIGQAELGYRSLDPALLIQITAFCSGVSSRNRYYIQPQSLVAIVNTAVL